MVVNLELFKYLFKLEGVLEPIFLPLFIVLLFCFISYSLSWLKKEISLILGRSFPLSRTSLFHQFLKVTPFDRYEVESDPLLVSSVLTVELWCLAFSAQSLQISIVKYSFLGPCRFGDSRAPRSSCMQDTCCQQGALIPGAWQGRAALPRSCGLLFSPLKSGID